MKDNLDIVLAITEKLARGQLLTHQEAREYGRAMGALQDAEARLAAWKAAAGFPRATPAKLKRHVARLEGAAGRVRMQCAQELSDALGLPVTAATTWTSMLNIVRLLRGASAKPLDE